MYDARLLVLLGTRTEFDKYRKYIQQYYLQKETKQVIADMEKYYKDNETVDEIDWEELRGYIHIECHPTWPIDRHEMYDAIIDNVKSLTPDPSIIARLNELAVADELITLATEAKDKTKTNSIEACGSLVEEYTKSLVDKDEDTFVDMDVSSLVSSVVKGDGIEWRLEDLNISVGQVYHSDFILVGKRPETGGTTFLTSEFTYMLSQLPEGKSAIIFNNEEGGDKIGLRLVQSALGKTTPDIEADPVAIQAEYNAWKGDRNVYIYEKNDGQLTTYDIKRVLKAHPECWLIGLNVLDKIGGFNKMDEVGRYRRLAQFARDIAREHGAVIAIAQADASAEGVQYLDQTQLYGSKTGVQGECDVMIMIGKDLEEDDVRYFSIAKNKKPITGRMDFSARHLRFKCKFDGNCGRFLSYLKR